MNRDELKIGIEKVFNEKNQLEQIVNSYKRIILLGNGGSNAIASHIAQDYTKILNKIAFSFTDSSRITCYNNDYGRKQAYKKFLEHFCERDTLVILISSSGDSINMLNAQEYCEETSKPYVLVTGFEPDNAMIRKSMYYKNNNSSNNMKQNFWSNSRDYGTVECVHMIFLHSII